MTRLKGASVPGFRAFPNYNSPSPPIYPTERKLKKPLMEKHRRERMNHSMNLLKDKIVHAHPHESSKLEKADILEKTVQYVAELESQTELLRREKVLHYQQGYLQACHELVELIAQQNAFLQNSNATELKQKLRQTVERHLKGKCASDPLTHQPQASSSAVTALSTSLQTTAMQLTSTRVNPTSLPRPIHPANMPFIMPAPFPFTCLPRFPVPSTTSASLFPFPAAQVPRVDPNPYHFEQTTGKSSSNDPIDEPTHDEEIDVERVEDMDKNVNSTPINTTVDSGMESLTSPKFSSELWRPF